MSAKTNRSKWLILLVILTAPLLYVIDIFIINMAVPVIKSKLHATQGEVQLIIAGYLLGSACFLISGGRAGDYLGRKKVFFWGMLGFTVTSAFCGLAHSALQLNIARFLQGISSAFMVTQSIALIQVLFPGQQERAKAIGWYGMTLSIAAIIGQILGGYLAESHFPIAGWRLIFFINVPVGLLAMWAISLYLPETSTERHVRFDYGGAVLLTISLGCIIYALTEGREQGWPYWSVVLLIAGACILPLFFYDQQQKLRGDGHPLIDMQLFRYKEFNIGLLAVLFHFMLHTAYLLMIAVYLQNGLGISALICGIYFVPHALLFMLSAALASKLLVVYGRYVLLAGLLIIGSSFLLQILLFGTVSAPYLNVSLIGLYGLGNGMVLPFLLNVALDKVPPRFAGSSSGVFSTFQQLASALGVSVIGGIFYNSVALNTAAYYKLALDNGLKAGMVCLGVVAGMLILLPRK
ncbi:MFS transporter [Pedobacter yulinensis]|uniref:MFS transporter n=1 Tax=Pedobacter yulinensis TaxID=2126353 RepID=A0A2T3HJT1_9SPHI|nr:MFS transporter [Pedobacter yulinensis]PST82697.1 MFS transporter [Pedobacter yulinensis]